MPEATVGEYMVRDVQTVSPDMTVEQVRQEIINSNFHGFPITEKGYLLGFVTAKELLRHIDKPNAKIRSVMKRGTLCAIPSMSTDDATRILFRYGLRNLPVVDEDKKLVGIISNIDIVRSQIEKSRPGKVMSVKNFLEQQNGLRFKVVNKEIPVDSIIPTQKEVYMDELIGRQYELKRGLNEPLIVVQRREGYLLVDGHHRIMAAKKLGLKDFKAIVLVPNDFDTKIGLEKTAERWGLHSLDDVKIIEGSKHPFMEITTMLLPSEEADGINQRLMDSVKDENGNRSSGRGLRSNASWLTLLCFSGAGSVNPLYALNLPSYLQWEGPRTDDLSSIDSTKDEGRIDTYACRARCTH